MGTGTGKNIMNLSTFCRIVVISLVIATMLMVICGCSSKSVSSGAPYKLSSLPMPKMAVLPIKLLNDSSTHSDIIKAYVASVYIQKKYIESISSIWNSIN